LAVSEDAGNWRFMVDASTVITHGVALETVDFPGASLLAEVESTMPFADDAEHGDGDRVDSDHPPPRESKMTLTLSVIAWSMPTRMSDPAHPCFQHTL
jgi:hypothetical protein